MSNLVISFASCLAKMVWCVSNEHRVPKSYMFNILEIRKNSSVRFSHFISCYVSLL